MMKRILGWIMALSLLMPLCAAAAEPASLPEEEYFALTEVGMQLWIPESLISLSLTEEDREDGYIAYFTSEDEAKALAVQAFAVGRVPLEDYKSFVLEYDPEATIVTINGLRWLRYVQTEIDAVTYTYSDENAYLLEITFAPVSDAEYADLAESIVASVRPL